LLLVRKRWATTSLCGNNNYCPSDNVTRGQIAAFIIRALYGDNFSYTTTPYFSDVPSSHVFFKYVQKLKDEWITTVSGTYLVDNPVSRSEMAAFLYRAFLKQCCGVRSSNVQSIIDTLMGEIGER